MTDSDVLIIGGGHNGLTCAAYLAAAQVSPLWPPPMMRTSLSVMVCRQGLKKPGLPASQDIANSASSLEHPQPRVSFGVKSRASRDFIRIPCDSFHNLLDHKPVSHRK